LKENRGAGAEGTQGFTFNNATDVVGKDGRSLAFAMTEAGSLSRFVYAMDFTNNGHQLILIYGTVHTG
jgi:hypothetical protein